MTGVILHQLSGDEERLLCNVSDEVGVTLSQHAESLGLCYNAVKRLMHGLAAKDLVLLTYLVDIDGYGSLMGRAYILTGHGLRVKRFLEAQRPRPTVPSESP